MVYRRKSEWRTSNITTMLGALSSFLMKNRRAKYGELTVQLNKATGIQEKSI